MPRGRGGDQGAAVDRVLRLIRFLAQRGDIGATVDELRELVPAYATVSQDSIARDVRNLEKAGWRIANTAAQGEAAHYRLSPRDHRLAVALTVEERAALRRLASHLELDPGPLAGSTVPPTESRDAPAIDIDVHWRRDGDGESAMHLLDVAIEQRCEVAFSHLGQVRRIQPYALRHGEGCWWVDGLDVDADAPRSFPVTRVEHPVLGAPGAFPAPVWSRPPTNDPLTWRRDEPVQITVEVEAEFAPDVRAAFAPVIAQDLEDVDRGRVLITVDVSHRAAFRLALFYLRGIARVVGPDDVVAEERAWLRQQVVEAR